MTTEHPDTKNWLNFIIADRCVCMNNLPSPTSGIVHAQNVLNKSAKDKACYYCGKPGHRQFHLEYPPLLNDPYVCKDCDNE